MQLVEECYSGMFSANVWSSDPDYTPVDITPGELILIGDTVCYSHHDVISPLVHPIFEVEQCVVKTTHFCKQFFDISVYWILVLRPENKGICWVIAREIPKSTLHETSWFITWRKSRI